MENKIRLKNIQLYGWHGATAKERKTGQQFEIDIEVLAAISSTIESDDIKSTVNYSALYEYVVKIFTENKYNLLETLAHKILISIKNEFQVKACKVTIRKPDAPINGILDTVEVEISNDD